MTNLPGNCPEVNNCNLMEVGMIEGVQDFTVCGTGP